jgi:hypothetical protein
MMNATPLTQSEEVARGIRTSQRGRDYQVSAATISTLTP